MIRKDNRIELELNIKHFKDKVSIRNYILKTWSNSGRKMLWTAIKKI